VRDVLSRPHLHELAVSSGFCQRAGKLSPVLFFDLLFYTVSCTEQGSLSYMVSLLRSKFAVILTKQALDERFTARCVFFVKSVLSEVLSEHLSCLYSKCLLPDFKRIRIKDSTKFFTPSTLKENYKGCGRGRSCSSISIQYEYDLKSGSVFDLNITSGNRNDRTDAEETSDHMEKGDLMIRDLGYFSTVVMEKFLNSGAFFLSRLDCSTVVYDRDGKRVCFKNVYKSMKEGNIVEKEMHVFIGEKVRLPVRLILQLVPDNVYEKRIVEKTKKSKGQGREQLTDETRIRCRFTLFITNADESILSLHQIFPLYRLRWQIELQFKVWKSVFKIDRLHRMKEHRYLTLLYVKLLQVMLNLQITYSLQRSLSVDPKKIKVLSLDKSMKTLKTLFDEIFRMFRETRSKSKEIAQNIQKRLLDNHWLESKKKKLCFPEILQLFICVSE